MNWKAYLIAGMACFLILTALAALQRDPGYMDAEYYYSMGERIAGEGSFSEPFIWNYLAEVDALPHPGFTYWMPLSALVAAFGMWVSGSSSFLAAKAGPIILAACVPPVTMKIAELLTGKREAAVLAGSLAVFPAFYAVYWGTTDSFGITMLLGGVIVLLGLRDKKTIQYLALGITAGLMHLTRADGLVWVLGVLLLAAQSDRDRPAALGAVAGGYLVVMCPWFFRNLVALGSILPGGTSKMLWLREYNDLFIYQASQLDYRYWISRGLGPIIRDILGALLANLKTFLLVQGQVILLPLIAFGFWRNRKVKAVQASTLIWIIVLGVMSGLFPFAGERGGFLHSGAAFQPLLWALAADGFLAAMDWGVEHRGWLPERAGKVFGASLVIIVFLTSGVIYYERVVGKDGTAPLWGISAQAAREIDQDLIVYGAKDPILINNPPGLYAATGRSSIAIPSGGVSELLLAADSFNATILVLEQNHPPALDGLYQYPESDERLIYLGSGNGVRYFRIAK